jgi:hypothetical protein
MKDFMTNFYKVGVVSPTKSLQANKGNKKYTKYKKTCDEENLETLSIERMIRHLEM